MSWLARQQDWLAIHLGDNNYLVISNLTDNHVTILDMKNDHKSFGPILGGTRGKTVIQKPEHVTTDYVAFPRFFLALHMFASLVADVLFVNSIPFLITMSRDIKYVTFEYLSFHTAKELSKELQIVMNLYGQGIKIVQPILLDMEFDSTIY